MRRLCIRRYRLRRACARRRARRGRGTRQPRRRRGVRAGLPRDARGRPSRARRHRLALAFGRRRRRASATSIWTATRARWSLCATKGRTGASPSKAWCSTVSSNAGTRALFCFMRQLPDGMRPSLTLRDDDFRLSFLSGTFVTLTNLASEDEARILEQRISPLRVSLHAADARVRRRHHGQARRARAGRARPSAGRRHPGACAGGARAGRERRRRCWKTRSPGRTRAPAS